MAVKAPIYAKSRESPVHSGAGDLALNGLIIMPHCFTPERFGAGTARQTE
jgi:hypothetical protein